MRLRAQGLRPIQIWVPDVRSPAFIQEAHRQSSLVAMAPEEAAEQEFVEEISIPWDE
jgi:hypothetical protein